MKNVNEWHVLALAVILSAVLISVGKWKGSSTFMAVFAYVLLGALYPPLAVGIGIIALLRLALTHPALAANPLTSFIDSVRGTQFTSYTQTQPGQSVSSSQPLPSPIGGGQNNTSGRK